MVAESDLIRSKWLIRCLYSQSSGPSGRCHIRVREWVRDLTEYVIEVAVSRLHWGVVGACTW